MSAHFGRQHCVRGPRSLHLLGGGAHSVTVLVPGSVGVRVTGLGLGSVTGSVRVGATGSATGSGTGLGLGSVTGSVTGVGDGDRDVVGAGSVTGSVTVTVSGSVRVRDVVAFRWSRLQAARRSRCGW